MDITYDIFSSYICTYIYRQGRSYTKILFNPFLTFYTHKLIHTHIYTQLKTKPDLFFAHAARVVHIYHRFTFHFTSPIIITITMRFASLPLLLLLSTRTCPEVILTNFSVHTASAYGVAPSTIHCDVIRSI